MYKPGIRKIAPVHGIAIKYMFFSVEFLNGLLMLFLLPSRWGSTLDS